MLTRCARRASQRGGSLASPQGIAPCGLTSVTGICRTSADAALCAPCGVDRSAGLVPPKARASTRSFRPRLMRVAHPFPTRSRVAPLCPFPWPSRLALPVIPARRPRARPLQSALCRFHSHLAGFGVQEPPAASAGRRYLNLQLWEASRLGRAELLAAVVQQGAELNAAFETPGKARRYGVYCSPPMAPTTTFDGDHLLAKALPALVAGRRYTLLPAAVTSLSSRSWCGSGLS
jgi:hypothetical protein